MKHIFYIALGGSLGAVARYVVSKNFQSLFGTIFPFGTLFVNATGSFVIGFLFNLFENTILPNDLKSFLTIGFLGAYTTFSTYSLETVNFIKDGEFRISALNILSSNIICILMVVAGIITARAVIKFAR